jgi:hypothetical protein
MIRKSAERFSGKDRSGQGEEDNIMLRLLNKRAIVLDRGNAIVRRPIAIAPRDDLTSKDQNPCPDAELSTSSTF